MFYVLKTSINTYTFVLVSVHNLNVGVVKEDKNFIWDSGLDEHI